MALVDSPRPWTSTERKHRAILDAAERVFLRDGFAGANMDDLTAEAGVSKQTVYAHFGSKEALFVDLVADMTRAAGDAVHLVPDSLPVDGPGVRRYLQDFGERQLTVVLTPRLLQLRRLVIGEQSRFPGLARALHDYGPRRAIQSLAEVIEQLTAIGLLEVDDPQAAATTFNWLVMAEPVNNAMLLGDRSVPTRPARRRHVARAVDLFLARYHA